MSIPERWKVDEFPVMLLGGPLDGREFMVETREDGSAPPRVFIEGESYSFARGYMTCADYVWEGPAKQ